MELEDLGTVLDTLGTDLQEKAGDGEGRIWHFELGGRAVVCVTDKDLLRLMIPLGDLEEKHSHEQFFRLLLAANFSRTEQARYCINDGILWVSYIHPISTLDATGLEIALEQLLNLALNTGTTFAAASLSVEE